MSRLPSQSQQAVDDLTMRIENKALIRGSGFIQFPPQVPFRQQVVVQPATVAQYEAFPTIVAPQYAQQYAQPAAAQQAAAYAAAPAYAQPQYAQYAPAAAPAAAYAQPPAYNAPPPVHQRAPPVYAAPPQYGAQQQRAPPPPAPAPAVRKALPGAIIAPLAQSRAQPQPQHVSRQAPSDDGDFQKTASQKKRDRKKARDGAK